MNNAITSSTIGIVVFLILGSLPDYTVTLDIRKKYFAPLTAISATCMTYTFLSATTYF